MAAETEGENACEFLWSLQNKSRSWLKKGDEIRSPVFTADALQSTKWSLSLVPIGNLWENYLEIRLYREKECNGPDKLEVNYKLAVLHRDRSLSKERISTEIYDKGHLGLAFRVERKIIFVTDREAFLNNDILLLQCTIWKNGATSVIPIRSFVRTIWYLKRVFITLEIKKFFTQDLKCRYEEEFIDFRFTFKEGLNFDEKLFIDVISFDKNLKYVSFKIFVMDSDEKKKTLGKVEFFESDLKKGKLSKLLSDRILREKNKYLANDTLSLYLVYSFSTGTIYDEFCSPGITPVNVTHVATGERNYCIVKAKYPHSPVLANDLKSVYNNGDFSDVELRTSTKTFPAHKLILIARSPVFKKMFSNEMKEANSGQVDLEDLENDTVHRMLLFMYTDSLEGLQFENACKLYVAADKYEILALKSLCSSFLKEHMSPSDVCEILALADQHEDNDLKNAAKHYILEHDNVFSSLEWIQFMATHLQLAAEVMYSKVYPGSKVPQNA